MSKKVERLEFKCETCGELFYLREKELKWQPGRFCSYSCYGKWRANDKDILQHLKHISSNSLGKKQPQKGLIGDKNPAWKGGILKNYPDIYVRCPIEYIDMKRQNGYVLEHRLLMAKHIGRSLTKDEVVHHIDHNPHNNDINNLMLFRNNKEHKLYEAQNKC